MDIGAKEIAAVEEVSERVLDQQVDELSSLQLSLVGGGCGEVLFG